MKTRTALLIIVITGVLMMGAGYLLQGSMGSTLATHWNAAGEEDGYGSTLMALYFLPLLTIGVSILIAGMPLIDPLKHNVDQFRKEYNLFLLGFAGFMYYIQGLTLAWNVGLKFSMTGLMAPGFGLLFIITGLMIRKAKRNYFIGIKTPWTLANDVVWDKTHDIGSKLFIVSGVLTTVCVFFPGAVIFSLLFTALASALITVVYSYFEFRKLEKTNR